MARKKVDPNAMSFLDHVEELRWAIIRSIAGIVLAGSVAFFFKEFLFDTIIFGPKNPDFISYRWFCDMGRLVGIESEFCSNNMDFVTQSRKMADLFSAHIWTSITAGIVIAFPWILWQVWGFISPGLKENERKYSSGFIIVCSLLFFLGVLFGYFMIAPLSVHFLATYELSTNAKFEPDLDSYIGLVRSSVLASGIIFELPVVIFFLTKIGLCTPQGMRKSRKYALVIVLIVAAFITPPDVSSQIIVAIPILILYEVSIFVSKWVLFAQNRKTPKITS